MKNNKTCRDCGKSKPAAQFSSDKRAKGGLKTHCKNCQRIRERIYWQRYNARHGARRAKMQREWKETNRDKVRNYARRFYHKRRTEQPEIMYMERRSQRLKRTYGITSEQYEALLTKQNGRCAICGISQTNQQKGKLHVDHDHKTNAVRGLLCSGCNLGLGTVNDQIKTLKAMITYLQQHNALKGEKQWR